MPAAAALFSTIAAVSYGSEACAASVMRECAGLCSAALSLVMTPSCFSAAGTLPFSSLITI